MIQKIILCMSLAIVLCLCLYSSSTPSNLHSIEKSAYNPERRNTQESMSSEVNFETIKEDVTGDNFLTDIENQVMDLINKERLSLGLAELEFDPRLQNAARIRSKELCQDEKIRNGKLAHIRPNGHGWQTVLINDIPVSGLVEAGEILARESTSNGTGEKQSHIPAKDWFLLWKSSKPHYDTITWPEAQKFGVGIYYEVINGEYYTNASVLFGRFAPDETKSIKEES